MWHYVFIKNYIRVSIIVVSALFSTNWDTAYARGYLLGQRHAP